jgi:hypothetical protein
VFRIAGGMLLRGGERGREGKDQDRFHSSLMQGWGQPICNQT